MHRNSLRTPSNNRGRVFPKSRYNGQSAKGHTRTINPDRFINRAEAVEPAEAFVATHQFDDFAFDPRLKTAIRTKGYQTPTPIQDGAIEAVLAGRDLIGLANTGTGKTAVFVLPIINRLLSGSAHLALIVVPTRELATQIDQEFRGFARGLGLYSALCVGGTSLARQIDQLSRGPQVVIGTPGRLKDLINQGKLRLGQTDIFVLDEADRMVDMGFIRDIRFIIDQLPERRQSLCLSATITPEIQNLIAGLLTDPVTVSVRTTETAKGIDQNIIRVSSKDHKVEVLKELLSRPDFDKVLVFGGTKWGVQRLADTLVKSGFTAEAIHGNKSQSQRQRALDAFKAGQVAVLVATDVAARGLDIPAVSHVINFDVPNTYEDYVHRIGRTGRAGATGQALTFVSEGPA